MQITDTSPLSLQADKRSILLIALQCISSVMCDEMVEIRSPPSQAPTNPIDCTLLGKIRYNPDNIAKKAESAPCGGKTAFETLNCGFILCIGGFSD